MANPLPPLVNALVSTHPFFTSMLPPAATLVAKRLLATKLILYEVRGRPWDSLTADLNRFKGECVRYDPRPQLGQAAAVVTARLNGFASAPWVAGEPAFASLVRFPGIYWGAQWTSTSQRPWMRDIVRRFLGLASPVPVTPADLAAYNAALATPNSGYANHDRARLLMKYNAADLPASLPGYGLVKAAFF